MVEPARSRVPNEPFLRPLLFSQPTTTHTTSPPAPPPPHPTTQARPRAREEVLSAEELQLARSLEESWRFRGAVSFVAEHGFEMVCELVQLVNAELELGRVSNPPAFLRWLAREQAR